MEGIAGLGFWLFIAIMIAVSAWEKVRKRQMKTDLLLRMIESGQEINDDMLREITSSEKKNPLEVREAAMGGMGLLFVLSGFGLVIAGVAIGFDPNLEMSYPFMGIGVFSFLLGGFIWSKMEKPAKAPDSGSD